MMGNLNSRVDLMKNLKWILFESKTFDMFNKEKSNLRILNGKIHWGVENEMFGPWDNANT